MALFKYFKPALSLLPKPDGPLSFIVPSTSIELANKEVKHELDKQQAEKGKPAAKRARGIYENFTPEEKCAMGKRAAEFGVTASLRHFSKKYPDRYFKESSIRTWRDKYLRELAKKKTNGEEVAVTTLPNKKRGRPLLLGEELDQQVQLYCVRMVLSSIQLLS